MPRGRKASSPHKLKLRNRQGLAVCWYRGSEYRFGKWDAATDRPTTEALAAFHRQVAIWAQNPFSVATEQSPYLVSLWHDWVKSRHAPKNSQYQLLLCARELFGTSEEPGPHHWTRVADFTAADLLAWQSRLCGLVNERGQRRLGRYMVNLYVGFVRKAFKWGVVTGVVEHGHAASLMFVPSPSKDEVKPSTRRKGVEWSRVDAVINLLPPPLKAATKLIRHTGSRPSEVLGLQVHEVRRSGKHFVESGVEIDLDAMGVWAVIMRKHKTESHGFDRVLFLGPKSQAVLTEYLATLDDATGYIFRPADSIRRSTRDNNDFYDFRKLNRAVKRACERAGVAVWTPYQLRHQVSKEIQAQYGRDAARVCLGHQVGGVTEIYAGSDLRLAAKVMREIG
jgi:integrase